MTTISYRQRAETITKLGLIATVTVAATIGLAGTAQADDGTDFRSPSGDVTCAMGQGRDINDPAHYGKGAVACQVKHTYPQPPLPDCPVAGREYDLFQGTPAALGCQGVCSLIPHRRRSPMAKPGPSARSPATLSHRG